VKDYPLSALVPDAKKKLVTFGVPVPQPDPKQLAWMQAEAAAPREKPGVLSKPMSLIRSGPGKEKMVAARTGTPNMEPETDTTSVADILSGGGKTQIGAGGSSSLPGNTAAVAIVTPGTGASGGSTVENGDTGATETPAPAADANSSGTAPATDAAPATTDGAAPATTGGDASASSAPADSNAKPADNATTDPKKESSSKKKKGLKKIIPW
jgi:hypothetical protein